MYILADRFWFTLHSLRLQRSYNNVSISKVEDFYEGEHHSSCCTVKFLSTQSVSVLTIFWCDRLLNTRLGQRMWWWDEHQPRALSQFTVPFGLSASSLCSSTNSFWARTSIIVSICCSSCENIKIFRTLFNILANLTRLNMTSHWEQKTVGNGSLQTFSELMSTENDNNILGLAMYLYYCLKVREAFLSLYSIVLEYIEAIDGVW